MSFRFLIPLIFILISACGDSNKCERISFHAKSLDNNHLGESARRNLSIYLPPGYESGSEKYPCIYFLHGFTADDRSIDGIGIKAVFDKAITEKRIQPVIVVFPDSYTKYKGSFYTNSSFNGKWADYVALDVVQYIDSKYRTIPEKKMRGICGHSMGGNGALKIAMHYPEIFGSVYALSPSVLNWGVDFGKDNPSFKAIQEASDYSELESDFYAMVFIGMASTFSPDTVSNSFKGRQPFIFRNNEWVCDSSVYRKWTTELPFHMIDSAVTALQNMSGIFIDWGNDDQFAHIPPTCHEFIDKLKSKGIKATGEEYIGGHGDKIGGEQGRINLSLIPFFNQVFLH